ncbi:MAG: MotA/TolQ/ExbB proton channel family protein [Rhodospirillaceae bacterium]|nr:MotA/TolQ/ExbB proton channel family protein [Rhodospirillaceae bacterium]
MTILLNLFNPLTLGAMLAGLALVAMVQNGPSMLWRGFAALPVLWRADPDRDMLLARATMTRVDHIANLRGLSCTDRVRAANPFLAAAIRKLADIDSADRFEIWAEQALADRRARHGRVHRFWSGLADTAPALGMAGTVVGLVGMFGAMNDPATIGPAMALAMLTTFYGVVIANLIAAPIAARLADLSDRELFWQGELCDRMLRVARRETAPVRRASIREVA